MAVSWLSVLSASGPHVSREIHPSHPLPAMLTSYRVLPKPHDRFFWGVRTTRRSSVFVGVSFFHAKLSFRCPISAHSASSDRSRHANHPGSSPAVQEIITPHIPPKKSGPPIFNFLHIFPKSPICVLTRFWTQSVRYGAVAGPYGL